MPLPSIPEYSTSIKTPALIHPAILAGGHPIEKGERIVKYSGGFCVVFPYVTSTSKYAVRCWHAEVSEAKRRTQIIADALKNSHLPYFVGFDYYEDGIMTPKGVQPIVVMDWVDAKALKRFLAENIHDTASIEEVAENFKKMASDLHKHNFSHGDLQHGNIMVKSDNSLVLVDYDSMYVPGLKGMPDEIKGLVGYQHEARWQNEFVTEKADYFSELVIYLSLKALAKYPSMWAKLNMEDTETLLFSGDDLKSKGTSAIFQTLRADRELSPMVEKLCGFLNMDSLDNLLPLESVLVSEVEGISFKWKGGNGYVPSPTVSEIDNPQRVASRWALGNGYSPKQNFQEKNDELVNSISNKFKQKT